MEAALVKKWEGLAERYSELTSQLMDPSVISQPSLLVKLSKERNDIESIAQLFHRHQDVTKQLNEAVHMLEDPSAGADLQSMAVEERARLVVERSMLEAQVMEFLTPKDPRDEKNLFLEVRAGAGGDEAALFAGDLFRMYVKFAERHKLRVDIVEASETGKGGYKNVIAVIEGKGGYGLFKYESGVHRVQRVPVTEAAGRIHTSTVTVAVMPEVDEVDVQITHIPTGVVVSCQDERSQLKNRNKAMRTLRARIVEAEHERQEAEIAQHRKAQVGTGDRSEKIRTYNFPQNRVTDHRVGVTLHKLEYVLAGDMDELIDALRAQQQQEAVAEAS